MNTKDFPVTGVSMAELLPILRRLRLILKETHVDYREMISSDDLREFDKTVEGLMRARNRIRQCRLFPEL